MRWTDRGRSRNLEDRRGASGGGRLPGGMGRLGVGGIIVILLISFVTKTNPLALIGMVEGSGLAGGAPAAAPAPVEDAAEEPMVRFVSFVLDDAQATWRQLFAQQGRTYEDATLVLFRDQVASACGGASAAVGPFYCPGDHKVYIDLGFFDELSRRFGAPGDFAQAYVLAHEIGHHVQALLGTNAEVQQLQRRRPELANRASVALELQADCYAGVWAHFTARRDLLEAGDVQEGLGAAAAVGDDRIQQQSQGRVSPESFTHGSSAQRVEWFERGLQRGTPEACDTFRGGR